MSNSLLYSFGKITERNIGNSLQSEIQTNSDEFVKYMDDVFAEIKKTDKRKNFFKLLFL